MDAPVALYYANKMIVLTMMKWWYWKDMLLLSVINEFLMEKIR